MFLDLKMENIALGGFDYSKPNENVRDLIVRLAGCGASMYTVCSSLSLLTYFTVRRPYTGEITSITYRSPEVFFGKPWTGNTDIWSWGIIVSYSSNNRYLV